MLPFCVRHASRRGEGGCIYKCKVKIPTLKNRGWGTQLESKQVSSRVSVGTGMAWRVARRRVPHLTRQALFVPYPHRLQITFQIERMPRELRFPDH